MSLDSELIKIHTAVPECLAAGFIDLTTGTLLSARAVPSSPEDVLDLVAAATSDLFQGTNVVAIEDLLKKRRGLVDDGCPFFREVVIVTEERVHVFQRCRRNESLVLVLVCRASANLGMVLSTSRASLADLEVAA